MTNLARSGASPKVAQVLARHSDINLTMGVYTDVDNDELRKAIDRTDDLIAPKATEKINLSMHENSERGFAPEFAPPGGSRGPEVSADDRTASEVV